MVTRRLDKEEMCVEANVAITKLRWERRARGVEDMSEEQNVAEEEELGDELLEQE